MSFLKRIQVTLDSDSGAKKVCDTGIKVPTLFKVGDVAKYIPDLVPNLGRFHLFKHNMNKYVNELGIVTSETSGTTINIQYKNLGETLSKQSSTYFNKMNAFSIGQIIRVKTDEFTVVEIAKEFGKTGKIEGSVGRVTGIDHQDPNRIFVQFDSVEIHDWLLDHRKSLPSSWMVQLESAQTDSDKELVEMMKKGAAAMIKAALEGDLRVAKLLYNRHGIDAGVRNSEDMTLLHIACQQGHTHFVDWLVNQVEVETEEADSKGFKAIHYAAMGGKFEVLKMLVDKRVQLNSRNDDGKTALHIAVNQRATDCIRFLIQHGCDVNIQDSLENTALHLAVYKFLPEIIEVLVHSGRVDFTLCNGKGLNVLHLAILRRNTTAIRLFLNKCNQCETLMETKDLKGMTPFLLACRQKDHVTIELLINAGANLNEVDDDGNSAIIIVAIHLKMDDSPFIAKVIQFLMEKGCDWFSINAAGKKAADILLTKGFNHNVIKEFDNLAIKLQISDRKNYCMGRADCFRPSAFHISCPHLPCFRACYECFAATAAICGCHQGEIVLVPGTVKLENDGHSRGKRKADAGLNLVQPAIKVEKIDVYDTANAFKF